MPSLLSSPSLQSTLVRGLLHQRKAALPAPPAPPGVENAALRAAPVHDPGEQLSQDCASAQYGHDQQSAQNRLRHGDYRREVTDRVTGESELRELEE